MSALTDLIEQVADPGLRARLMAEAQRLGKRKKFGLVFEEHLPECTPLPGIPIRRGSTVARKNYKLNENYTVLAIKDNIAFCANKNQESVVGIPVAELVAVAEFGDPIYPYLQKIDSISRAPESDLWHTLIEADNYHALQLLEYLYCGKVDCIYIDPPYNTGAKDWKYNNDYVDSNDSYRHSKWLSMMQKRLNLAKKLLNPKESVLIVTIDEKEYLHLGCLLEEMFPEARIQMVSSVINASGTKRLNSFSRTDEYLYFVMFGDSVPLPLGQEQSGNKDIHWRSLRRGDLESMRGTSKGGVAQFYPIYVNVNSNQIEHIGEPLSTEINRQCAPQIENCVAVFPIRDNGIEMNWGVRPETAKLLHEKGFLRVGGKIRQNPQQYNIQYLTSGSISDIENGVAILDGYAKDGSVIAHYESGKPIMPKTNWSFSSHDATQYGTNLLSEIMTDKRFSYPKSLYAVKESINLFLANKHNALIVDFFAGSGTTLHAVNLLNAEDGGKRRCIMVTNNEVSESEAKNLTEQGFQPGDEEWEKLGIARYVTWPRTVCSIEGRDVNGNPLKGNYLGSDLPMSEGFRANAIYFKLGFLDKNAVALGRQFRELLPLLWLKAGGVGQCPSLSSETLPGVLVLPQNHFAVLCHESALEKLETALEAHPEIETVYIITDYEAGYSAIAKNLKVKFTYQLYRDYLDNFRINMNRN